MDALTTASTAFGPAEWVFFAAHIALVVAGIYLRFFFRPRSALAARPVQLLSYGLLGLGAIGTLIGALRLAGVALPGLLMTVVTILDLVLVIFALYYARSVYPQLQAQALRGRPPRTAAAPRTPTAPRGSGAAATAHSADLDRGPGSGRRDARRSQKRRKR
jgi:hypothetical protein